MIVTARQIRSMQKAVKGAASDEIFHLSEDRIGGINVRCQNQTVRSFRVHRGGTVRFKVQ